jgi:hypothetical protein
MKHSTPHHVGEMSLTDRLDLATRQANRNLYEAGLHNRRMDECIAQGDMEGAAFHRVKRNDAGTRHNSWTQVLANLQSQHDAEARRLIGSIG